jgi:hypothetical protein
MHTDEDMFTADAPDLPDQRDHTGVSAGAAPGGECGPIVAGPPVEQAAAAAAAVSEADEDLPWEEPAQEEEQQQEEAQEEGAQNEALEQMGVLQQVEGAMDVDASGAAEEEVEVEAEAEARNLQHQQAEEGEEEENGEEEEVEGDFAFVRPLPKAAARPPRDPASQAEAAGAAAAEAAGEGAEAAASAEERPAPPASAGGAQQLQQSPAAPGPGGVAEEELSGQEASLQLCLSSSPISSPGAVSALPSVAVAAAAAASGGCASASVREGGGSGGTVAAAMPSSSNEAFRFGFSGPMAAVAQEAVIGGRDMPLWRSGAALGQASSQQRPPSQQQERPWPLDPVGAPDQRPCPNPELTPADTEPRAGASDASPATAGTSAGNGGTGPAAAGPGVGPPGSGARGGLASPYMQLAQLSPPSTQPTSAAGGVGAAAACAPAAPTVPSPQGPLRRGGGGGGPGPSRTAGLVLLRPRARPPAAAAAAAEMGELGLPEVLHRDPFYGDPSDKPARPVIMAGREFRCVQEGGWAKVDPNAGAVLIWTGWVAKIRLGILHCQYLTPPPTLLPGSRRLRTSAPSCRQQPPPPPPLLAVAPLWPRLPPRRRPRHSSACGAPGSGFSQLQRMVWTLQGQRAAPTPPPPLPRPRPHGARGSPPSCRRARACGGGLPLPACLSGTAASSACGRRYGRRGVRKQSSGLPSSARLRGAGAKAVRAVATAGQSST